MGLIEIVMVALGLAMDAFAVSIGAGTNGNVRGPRPVFRLSFHFGLFQALMPIIGWLVGTRVAGYISGIDHWVAMALLAFVGVRMIRSGLSKDCDECPPDPSRGGTLVMLSVATSIDALAVGLSLAMLRTNIFYPAAVIGIITGSLSLLGVLLGRRLGGMFGKRMEVLGGLILNSIGVRVVLAHIL
jgi:putative Mn2+ efflux pump MntP